MLKTNIFRYLLAAGAILAVSALPSCSKIGDFGTTNQNPGSTTTPIPSGLLTNVLSGLGNRTFDQGGVSTIAGLYVQYFTETQYTETSRYAKSQPNFDGFYYGALNNLQQIINYNSNAATAATAAAYGSNDNQIAVARILKAYYFWYLTDLWGDIPYSKALQGDNGIVAYDTQESIYTDLFKELTEAVAQIKTNELAPKGDILFGGDLNMWKKFGNSIHALMALRLSKVNPTLGKTEFNAALNASGGVFEQGQNAAVNFPGGNFFNPVYNYYVVVARLDYAVTDFTIGVLKNTADARLSAFASSAIGFPYGLTRDNAVAFNNANPGYAKVEHGPNTSPTAPEYVISSSQVYLARAEAAQLGWTSESAADNYQLGIQENWKNWGVFDQTNFNNYIAQTGIAFTGGDEIKKIATQEWLADYPNGAFGWADWRRTGYPALTPAPGQNLAIPRRMAYGLNEFSLNTKNVEAASALYTSSDGTNSQYGKVWWDK